MLTTLTPEAVRSVIHGRIRSILNERFGEDRAFSAHDKLNATLGLSSLDLAFLVADLLKTKRDGKAKQLPAVAGL